ncbi:type II toxin-antitoxin system RelE/ParE family toxin [Teredinibacter franksiae]|uniref:type II toxin-antitoxin system RelE/ParE family toxin n=1 Tax=Teredinibacter franksiae TaxID=2761453 RepID=UPI0016297D28|nr:type II toxin-antitoxin system RelE/ParE family toxin [Teredinibacter franksiae]
MIIIETSVFTRRIKELMGDDEYKEFQEALVSRPDMGAIIQGTGGLRKVRWKLEGKGKSGGVRAIYYWMTEDEQIYMLYVYPKSEQEDLTSDQKKALKTIVERWSDEK